MEINEGDILEYTGPKQTAMAANAPMEPFVDEYEEVIKAQDILEKTTKVSIDVRPMAKHKL